MLSWKSEWASSLFGRKRPGRWTMPVTAEKLYNTALNMAEEKDLKILERDDKNFRIKVTEETDRISTGQHEG